jgi:endonuclease III
MIDPVNITNFKRSKIELEEFAIFAILVAGKTAKTIAPRLENLLIVGRAAYGPGVSPLAYFGGMPKAYLAEKLREAGIGCGTQKASAIVDLWKAYWFSGLNLHTCQPADLEKIKGIGLKTSRFFIMHSREKADIAALDTHILKGLAERGYKVPKTTPSNPRMYAALEQIFLAIAKSEGKTPAELDLEWWRHYSGNKVGV